MSACVCVCLGVCVCVYLHALDCLRMLWNATSKKVLVSYQFRDKEPFDTVGLETMPIPLERTWRC